MGKRPQNYFESDEEEVDEPEDFQDSGDSWTPEVVTKKKPAKRARGKASPAKKKPVLKTRARAKTPQSSSASSEEEADEGNESDCQMEDQIKIEKAIIVPDTPEKKATAIISPMMKGTNNTSSTQPNKIKPSQPSKYSKLFCSGTFITSKSEIDNGGEKDGHIWRVGGGSLLQKFAPQEEDGKTYYMATTKYTSWECLESRDEDEVFEQIKLKNETLRGDKLEKFTIICEDAE